MSEAAVMRSIKPYWFYLIVEGLKGVELAKSEPLREDWAGLTYLYLSKDVKSLNRIPAEKRVIYQERMGKVVAEFVCDAVWHAESPHLLVSHEQKSDDLMTFYGIPTGMTRAESMAYFGEGPAYGWNISDFVFYDKSKELHEFSKGCNKTVGTDCKKCVEEYSNVCHSITRPPQSWCYCEAMKKRMRSI